MPKTKIDYSNTTIYKLCCKDITITEIYIGHTTDMRRRKWQHKTACNNEKGRDYNYYVYQFIRDNGGWDNWDMIEVEKYNAIDGYDATKRERYFVEELKASLNTVIPSRKQKEWVEDNKEYVKEYKKEYYENNKEILLEKQKEWVEDNKEYVKEYKKEYRENNRNILLEKNKQWWDNNKEIINKKRKEKITCERGCLTSITHLKRHQQTKRHIELMANYPIRSSIIHLTSAGVVDTIEI